MNKMKSVGIVVLSLIIASCCTTKKSSEKALQNKHSFKIISATYSSNEAEQATLKEIHVLIVIDNPEIQLDSIYFKNSKTGLKRDISASRPSFVGSFLLSDIQKDYYLHSDPQKEYGNTPPGMTSKIPFQLQENEAVVSYAIKEETLYYKISDLKEIKKD
jgi:hypothetical protein